MKEKKKAARIGRPTGLTEELHLDDAAVGRLLDYIAQRKLTLAAMLVETVEKLRFAEIRYHEVEARAAEIDAVIAEAKRIQSEQKKEPAP